MEDREPILPPRPSLRRAAWAAANAAWFHVAGALAKRLVAAVRAGRRPTAPREETPVSAPASGAPQSLGLDPWVFGRVSARRRDASDSDRPTVVQVRRAS
jgi:hypothetical protein